jgi:hypothetical protein
MTSVSTPVQLTAKHRMCDAKHGFKLTISDAVLRAAVQLRKRTV